MDRNAVITGKCYSVLINDYVKRQKQLCIDHMTNSLKYYIVIACKYTKYVLRTLGNKSSSRYSYVCLCTCCGTIIIYYRIYHKFLNAAQEIVTKHITLNSAVNVELTMK